MSNPTTFTDFVSSRKIEENLIDVTDAVDWDAIGLSYLDGKHYIEKQYDEDAVHAELHNVSYVVTIGNQREDFGDDLDAAERFLWNEWARAEENWKHVRFDSEFGSDYQLDQGQVLDLIDNGFVDNSWHNDICPSFDLAYGDDDCDRTVRVWFDAPNPEDREVGPDSLQFSVCAYSDGFDNYEELVQTDDFYLALAVALGHAAKPVDEDDWGSDRQIDAQNNFGCLLIDWILPKADAEKLEVYGLKATTEEFIDYGIELVKYRNERKVVTKSSAENAIEAIVLDVIDDRDDIEYFNRKNEELIERPDGGYEVRIPVAAWFAEYDKMIGGELTIEITEDFGLNDTYANWN